MVLKYNFLVFPMALFLLLCKTINAQIHINHKNKKYNLYPELRLHYNRQILDEPDIENTYGMGVTFFNQWYRFEHFNLIGGISFNQTSATIHKVFISQTEYYNNIEYRLNTIGLPMLIRGNIGKNYILYFETGVMPNFTIGNIGKGMHFYTITENNKAKTMAESWNKRTNHFKTLDITINNNAGIKIPANNLDFTLGVGIDYGMFEIHNYHDKFKNFFLNAFVGIGLR